MRDLRLHRPRALAVLMPLALLATGCNISDLVSPGNKPAGVEMHGQNVDLAFGTPPAAKTKVPVPTRPQQPQAVPPLQQLLNPLPPPPPPVVSPFPSPPPIATQLCPPPAANTGADRQISDDVKGQVRPGVYPFMQKGTLQIAGLSTIKIGGATTRTIKDVVANSDGSYDYTEDELLGLLFHMVLRYHVVPGKGIYLASLVVTYKNAKQSFKPVLPVKIFQLPASPQVPTVPTQPEQPVQFADVGVDPVDGATMVSQGTIGLTAQRVNGCRSAADGWHVDATWSFQFGPSAQPFKLTYTVAPQYGGFVIADRVQATDTVGPVVITVDIKSRFGSLHPQRQKKTATS